MERDVQVDLKFPQDHRISTHTLTWSVTSRTLKTRLKHSISTHTLTWSVTFTSSPSLRQSTFQLTRSRGAWLHRQMFQPNTGIFQLTRSRGAWPRWEYLPTLPCGHFNSHAHVERDLAENICQLFHVVISTHTLTWSVTKGFRNAAEQICISTHTLTWSVTRLKNSLIPWKSNFNSHAHVERDRDACMVCNANPNFNSHAHVERDTDSERQYIVNMLHFNSHAHVERDWFKVQFNAQ